MEPFTPGAGMHITEAIKRAIAYAKEHGTCHTFEFNGSILVVEPGSNPAEIELEWIRERERADAAYSQTLKAKAERIAQLRAGARQTIEANSQWENVVAALNFPMEMDRALLYLKRYAEAADHGHTAIDVVGHAGLLVSRGFSPNAYLIGQGFDPEDANITARYIFGQALEAMLNGMPPHPMTGKFVDDWLTKFKAPR